MEVGGGWQVPADEDAKWWFSSGDGPMSRCFLVTLYRRHGQLGRGWSSHSVVGWGDKVPGSIHGVVFFVDSFIS